MRWLRLSLLIVISLVAGFHLLLSPETVHHLIIRIVGFVWILEGIGFLLDLVILVLENKLIDYSEDEDINTEQ
jgi:hypothetical protein